MPDNPLFGEVPSSMPVMRPDAPSMSDDIIASRSLFAWNSEQINPALEHVNLFGAIFNQASKSYSWRWDEAYKRSRKDALAMTRDCWIMSLFNERRFPVSQASWHLEPENKRDKSQKAVADHLTACIQATPDLESMLFELQWAIWYGRAGMELTWNYETVRGKRSLVAQSWYPVNGDKIQFTYDGKPELMLYTPKAIELEKRHPGTEIRRTDRWMVLVLNQAYWRDRYIIHKHDCIDADFFAAEMAGGVHGVGIRHWCYWKWWMLQELITWATDFMERIGLGFTVYYYEAGNQRAQSEAIRLAKQQGRNTWVVWPRLPGEGGAVKGIERIEPSTSGADFIVKLVEWLESKIERFIVGQSMSGGADNDSGLGGSGRAKFAQNTKTQILKADASKLAGTLTRDLVRVCQRYNAPQANYPISWKFDLDEEDPKELLDAAKGIWEMGADVDEDDLRGKIGLNKPEGDAKVLRKQDQDQGQDDQAKAAATMAQNEQKLQTQKQLDQHKLGVAKQAAAQKIDQQKQQHTNRLQQIQETHQTRLEQSRMAAEQKRQLALQQQAQRAALVGANGSNGDMTWHRLFNGEEGNQPQQDAVTRNESRDEEIARYEAEWEEFLGGRI